MKTLNLSRACFLVAALCVAVAVNPSLTLALTVTWTGGGDGASWSDANNWDDPFGVFTGDDLVFPDGTGFLAPSNDIAGIEIGSASAPAFHFTGSTDSFTIGGTEAITARCERRLLRFRRP